MIIGLVEVTGGLPESTSLEALTLARTVGQATGLALEAVLVGPGAREAAAGLGAHGVSTAHVVEHPRLDDYAPEAWAAAVAQLAAARGATLVIASATDRGSEVLAHVAVRLDAPLAANCSSVSGHDPFVVTRQRWGGSLLETARVDGPVRVLTVAPHALVATEATAPAAVTVAAFDPELSDAEFRVRVTARVAPEAGKVSLADAKVVVGGGRGVGSAEGFAIIEELAGLLGGAVGVSRVVTSAGWRPHAEQVGQTGTRIAPDIYIACGISGAIQHRVGSKGAKRILAINKDPDAPMVEKATYAVIGDLHAIVPAISAEIRRVNARPG